MINARFLEHNVNYLGYYIDKTGLHTTCSKVATIKKAPMAKNIIELQAFLCLVYHYGRFLSKLLMVAHTINHLLSKNISGIRIQNVMRHLRNSKHN